MTRMTRILALLTALATAHIAWDGLVPYASAQATLRSTTLAAALSETDTTVSVASATGIAADMVAYVDREAMKVRSISGTNLTVTRGREGTQAVAHPNSAVIWVDKPEYFIERDLSGSCTSTDELVLPRVNVLNGNVWQCYSSRWALYLTGAPVQDTPRVRTAVLDVNGNEALRLTATASAVNDVTLANAATTAAPSFAATGDDTNIGIIVKGKGTGAVRLGQTTSTDVRLEADQPIADSAGNELLKFTKATTAVNELTVANAATGAAPAVSATGGDTNISVKLAGKGTGLVLNTSGQYVPVITVTTESTVGNVTVTAAQMLGGLILRDPNGAARTDTLSTAALLVAAVPNAVVGSSFKFTIRNTADAAETITVAGGTGGTTSGTMTIAQSNSKEFLVRLDNVTAASEAYTVYSLGTIVH